ncbi:MAG: hypothetical protein A3F73_06535 [Gallionellales bacterium RIFCSPLOWO2_12_FULL_59_22]|nr:MAG: hypothetical protein A3H99_11420 [Gallionellales bacterium RIFCSPLOWO2_02_FULL_59_110]OGT02435.1 MAG: hypothetical protein A2Z65_08765 [Gallionellales bacterium RIFCSPLOWO2_02_58_13]OGT13455.1 MAG: hypothetical protein A3F73_06535 [Gallionellales bacterium RIFCSPLOWO2_12_FULL_59_22]
MKTADRKNFGRLALRKRVCLVLALLLPCASCSPYAAAAGFGETATDGLRAPSYRLLAEEDSAGPFAPGLMENEKKLVWRFRAGHKLVMGLSDRDDSGRLMQVLFERSSQLFSGREQALMPRINVRLERQF